jgi:hypothetical protein
MRRSLTRWILLGGVVVAPMGAVVSGSRVVPPPVVPLAEAAAVPYDLKECPRHWDLPKSISAPMEDGFALTGPITDVPEFHDCQKLLNSSGRAYGPLAAVFAAYDLETLEQRLDSLTVLDSVSPAQTKGRVSLAAGMILNLGVKYQSAEFQIQTGFSCLYVWKARPTGTWSAKLVYVNTDHRKCLDTIRPDMYPGNLTVRRDSPTGFTKEQYPPVARWDWDDRTRQQYVGIKCGKGWCEVGASTFNQSVPYLSSPADLLPASQVQRIKGWYDQQYLAEPGPSAGGWGPSPTKGTVIPAPGYMPPTHPADWRSTVIPWHLVAYIAINRASPYYKAMLNLDQTPPNAPLEALNRLWFCYGTRSECSVPDASSTSSSSVACGHETDPTGLPRKLWWARIDAAGGGPHMFKCVRQTDHSGEVASMPPTARWRWLAQDETIWKECLTGCCQVQAQQ